MLFFVVHTTKKLTLGDLNTQLLNRKMPSRRYREGLRGWIDVIKLEVLYGPAPNANATEFSDQRGDLCSIDICVIDNVVPPLVLTLDFWIAIRHSPQSIGFWIATGYAFG